MDELVWHLGNALGTTCKLTFIFTGIVLFYTRIRGKEPHEALRWIFRIAKRCYPALTTVYWVSEAIVNGPLNGWDAIFIVMDWYNYRNLKGEDDDDYWKRVREKVTDVVKQVGTRLVVTPATASAGT